MSETNEVQRVVMRFVVLGRRTHFTYNPNTNQINCTHGGWGGKLKTNKDGSCSVAKVAYQSYEFTSASNYDAAVEAGILDA
jgi:hypothetical protein